MRVHAHLTILVVGFAGAGVVIDPLSGAEQKQPSATLKSDSRAPYVHRLTLYDHDGKAINPSDELAAPYSPRATCGKCHDYSAIRGGWHFNADRPNVDAGRPGEPWIFTDSRMGLQIPISARGWPGTFKPQKLGLSHWQFVLAFGHHLPGGGLGDPADDVVKPSAEAARWNISGRLEIDCMFCHSADSLHDPAEAERQIERQNFRWSPTAALGLAVVRGEARTVPDDWDPVAPPNPDFPERQPPKVIYDRTRFDADDRVFFNITRRPPVGRCYFCHSVREVGSDAPQRWQQAGDVHIAAGMVCTDCHRNDIGHMITRGYPGERLGGSLALPTPEFTAALSCAGCHLGVERATAAAVRLGGRMGAPHPLHRGIPAMHFDILTCTACHSGPWPDKDPRFIQTAMAHGLGIASRERSDSQLPRLIEPIFARLADGKIAPQRLIWPSYWARLKSDVIEPLPLARIQAAAKVLPRSKAKPLPTNPLTDDEIAALLAEFGKQADANGEPVYVRDGWVYRRNGAGQVSAEAHPGGRPYLWPLAHDVRPAAQSLGVRGCTDCHAADAPIYFGRVAVTGGSSTPPVKAMYEIANLDARLARLWAASFGFRPAVVWITAVCALVLGMLVMRAVWQALDGLSRRLR